MEESKGNKFVCEICNKTFPSGKSLGGHKKIHTKKISADSDNPKKNNNRLVDRRDMVLKEPVSCAKCCKDLSDHTCHSGQSDSESSSASEIERAALVLVMMSKDTNYKKGHKVVENSLAESSDKTFVIKNQDYPINDPKNSEADISVYGFESEIKNSLNSRVRRNTDELRLKKEKSKHDLLSRSGRALLPSSANGAHSLETDSLADTNSNIHRTSGSSDRRSTLMVNNAGGAKEKNKVPSLSGHMKKYECPTCFKVFKSGQALGGHLSSPHKKQEHRIEHQTSEIRVKEGGSKHDLSRSERPSYKNGEHSSDTDSLTDETDKEIDDKAGGAGNKNKVYKSSSQASVMRNQIDLNLPASDIDEPEPEPQT